MKLDNNDMFEDLNQYIDQLADLVFQRIIEKYGAIESNPNSEISVAANLAFNSADLHASGKGASTKSIISTVATDVGLATGGLSTSCLFKADKTLCFFVIDFISTPYCENPKE